MTTLPQIPVLDNIVAFTDDTDPNLFYLIKTVPQLRTDEGNPIFNGLFWTDKADGSSEATAGLGGGSINFDINLAISEEEQAKAAQKIKSLGLQRERRRAILKLERERLGLIARARGEKRIPDPDVPPVGEVVFGALQFTEGTVELLGEHNGNTTEHPSSGGTASLVGDNNAAFGLRLGHEGAAVWYKALQQGDKAISARYVLEFLLRLPSLEIRAWAGASQQSSIERKVDRVWKNVDKGCKDADVERIDVKSVVENLSEEGLVNIEIKKGSTTISDEHVSQLRSMAMKLIEEKVKEIIKSRVRGMTEEERKTSMIELMKEEIHSFVELRFTQRDVVKWKIAPQATLTDFLSGVSEEKIKNITKLVDLSDKIVDTVAIPIHVDAPWDEEPNVSSVKVLVAYPSANEQTSFIFKKGTEHPVWRFRRPENDDGIVSYHSEIYFKGVSHPLVTPVRETNGAVTITVGKMGMMQVLFKAHPTITSLTGANKITAIEVHLSYKETEHPDHFATSIVFTPEQTEGKLFKRTLYKEIDAPLSFTVTYFTAGNDTIQIPSRKLYFTENQSEEVTTENPFKDTLEIDVELSMVPDPSLTKITVEFEYEDADNDFKSEEVVVLSAEYEWDAVSTRLVIMDKSKQQFKYRYKVAGANSFSKSDWIEGTGDTSIILPIQKVSIDAGRLKLEENDTHALLDLNYTTNSHTIQQQFMLTGKDTAQPFFWYIPRTNTTKDQFTYDLTVYPKTGNPIVQKGKEGRGGFLIINP